MKKLILRSITVIIILMAVSVPFFVQAQSKPLIVASTTDIASIAQAIAGDNLEVISMLQGGDNPTYLAPDLASQLRAQHAVLYLKNGFGLEDNWEKTWWDGVNNPLITPDSEAVQLVTAGITPKPSKVDDPEATPIHYKDANPFVWLDPANSIKIINNIYEILGNKFPDFKEDMNTNRKRYIKEFQNDIDIWKKRCEAYKGVRIVAYNHNLDYFTDSFGLNVVEYVEPAAGVAPGRKRIASLMDSIKNNGIKLMLVPDYVSLRLPKQFQEETGIKLVIVPTSCGGSWAKEYNQLFPCIVSEIHKTIQVQDNQ
ncbi:MAG: hypothetical protein C4541_10415 [Candidatus Auribacter fodinae]|jgi:ABC-type Zn uptake system ZnuABC Zn-binding protein ZnuA|uniref:Zinc ABC transporter substrate-binding protein n=1 Tax=Candidatus Auribacter fodinae TaxID=2093366 RepID=A0A3A4QTR7_9BACT|nr:MAG: hypothetical protein C4541_10415 [Candidatus Auribacter fodinae]